jgi:hypothetical protein
MHVERSTQSQAGREHELDSLPDLHQPGAAQAPQPIPEVCSIDSRDLRHVDDRRPWKAAFSPAESDIPGQRGILQARRDCDDDGRCKTRPVEAIVLQNDGRASSGWPGAARRRKEYPDHVPLLDYHSVPRRG